MKRIAIATIIAVAAFAFPAHAEVEEEAKFIQNMQRYLDVSEKFESSPTAGKTPSSSPSKGLLKSTKHEVHWRKPFPC